jgi:hypothetical protein
MRPLYQKYFFFLVNILHHPLQLLLCHSLVPQQNDGAKTNGGSILKRSFYLGCVIVLAMHLEGCEKVIDVDLNDTEKKYVIEAVLTDHANSCKVLLTQTKNFDDDNTFAGVTGAQVTISDNNGVPITLTETGAGVYEAKNLVGTSGHRYSLVVNVSGQKFTATSTMPQLVSFDSLYISERSLFGETYKFATVSFKDPPGTGNAYRYIQYVNGVKEKTIFVRDDDYSDDLTVERVLFYFNDDDEKKLKSRDNVIVEMLCIDYPIYKYWFSLAQSSTGENQSATPGNPVTNIEGGALGYFSAHTIQSKSVVVP